jgi:hypothetical protein
LTNKPSMSATMVVGPKLWHTHCVLVAFDEEELESELLCGTVWQF